jgi:hypothetical protein
MTFGKPSLKPKKCHVCKRVYTPITEHEQGLQCALLARMGSKAGRAKGGTRKTG